MGKNELKPIPHAIYHSQQHKNSMSTIYKNLIIGDKEKIEHLVYGGR